MSPKISIHGGATNAHGAEVSPADDVSEEPQAVSQDGLGHSTTEEAPDENADREQEQEQDAPAEDDGEADAAKDYNTMTITELRAEATRRGIPSFGNKSQVIERLKGADGASDEPAE
jgi:hypothetical protein